METGTFFRNRDLFTIFRRISNNSEKVNFNSFINALYAWPVIYNKKFSFPLYFYYHSILYHFFKSENT